MLYITPDNNVYSLFGVWQDAGHDAVNLTGISLYQRAGHNAFQIAGVSLIQYAESVGQMIGVSFLQYAMDEALQIVGISLFQYGNRANQMCGVSAWQEGLDLVVQVCGISLFQLAENSIEQGFGIVFYQSVAIGTACQYIGISFFQKAKSMSSLFGIHLFRIRES
ncbi:MAG: hypothetical protein KGN01_07715 [Patescibacteria group bacterium]|nr:hypothetical protein [Patescibacteria group bacterium]